MREILFRGKRTDNGEWVYGDLLNVGVDYDYAIRTYGGREHGQVNAVNEKTVGQYTGLTDNNGKRIFDGDILVFCKGATHPIKVYWDGLGWKFFRNGKRIEDAFECNTISHIQSCEVIGNIHDNPELLEGE